MAAGLQALPDRCAVVLVHDAARCLAPPEPGGAGGRGDAAAGCGRAGAAAGRHREAGRRRRPGARHPRPRRPARGADPAGLRPRAARARARGGTRQQRHRRRRPRGAAGRAGARGARAPLALKITTADDLGRAAQLLADADAPAARMGS
nr:hypothetical protein [Angustibacter aerolatus]